MISVSGVASPLLAGGALALAGVIVQQEDALRYPGVALLLLVGAMLLLIAAMQCGAWAVQHAGVSAEDGRWWSIANDDRRSASVAEWQNWHTERHRVWSKRFRVFFSLGVMLLWAAIAVVAVPRSGVQEPGWRWIAAALAAGVTLAEAGWIVLVTRGPGKPVRYLGWATRWVYGAPPPVRSLASARREAAGPVVSSREEKGHDDWSSSAALRPPISEDGATGSRAPDV